MIQDKTLAMSCENKENNKENTMEKDIKRAQSMSNVECESVSGKSPESGILGIRDTLVTYSGLLPNLLLLIFDETFCDAIIIWTRNCTRYR